MDATTVAETLRELADLLEFQVAGAADAPALIGKVDGAGLLAYAQRRTDSTTQSTQLMARLGQQLDELVQAKAIAQPTVAALADSQPAMASTLLSGLGRLRRNAQTLARLDARCRASASRALGLVRSYASVLRPVARAYNGRGDAARFEPALTYSQRA